jgi:hypothetical protein
VSVAYLRWRSLNRSRGVCWTRDEITRVKTLTRRRALEAQPGFLNKFEQAQIMYLRPESVEVAVALIPRWAVSPRDPTSSVQLYYDCVTEEAWY